MVLWQHYTLYFVKSTHTHTHACTHTQHTQRLLDFQSHTTPWPTVTRTLIHCHDVRSAVHWCTCQRQRGVEEVHMLHRPSTKMGTPQKISCQGLAFFYTPTLRPGQGTSKSHHDFHLHLAPIAMYLEDTPPTEVLSQVGGYRSDEPQFTVPPKTHLEAWDIQSEQPERIKQRWRWSNRPW